MEGVVARERRIPMNMRLLILSLIALLGLGSMEAAEVNAGSSGDLSLGQEKQLLDQQHQALEGVRKQQDSHTQSYVTHHSKIQQHDQDKKGHNQRTGRQ